MSFDALFKEKMLKKITESVLIDPFNTRVVADLAAANSKNYSAPLAQAKHSLLRVSRILWGPEPAVGSNPLRRGQEANGRHPLFTANETLPITDTHP